MSACWMITAEDPGRLLQLGEPCFLQLPQCLRVAPADTYVDIAEHLFLVQPPIFSFLDLLSFSTIPDTSQASLF